MKKIIYLVPALILSAAIARADSFEADKTSGEEAFTGITGSYITAMAGQTPPTPVVEVKKGGDLELSKPIYSDILKAEALFESSALPSTDALLGAWDLVTATSEKKMGNFGFVTKYLSFVKTETGLTAKIRKGLAYTDHAVTLNDTSAVFSETKKMEDYDYSAEFMCRLSAKDSLVCEIQGRVEHPQKHKQLPNTYLMLKRH